MVRRHPQAKKVKKNKAAFTPQMFLAAVLVVFLGMFVWWFPAAPRGSAGAGEHDALARTIQERASAYFTSADQFTETVPDVAAPLYFGFFWKVQDLGVELVRIIGPEGKALFTKKDEPGDSVFAQDPLFRQAISGTVTRQDTQVSFSEEGSAISTTLYIPIYASGSAAPAAVVEVRTK